MNRLHLLFIILLLTKGLVASAQQGHELDTLGRFDFLKQHPTSGSYEIDYTTDMLGRSITRIHFFNDASFHHGEFDSHADFYKAQFDSRTDFSRAQFNAQAYFYDTQFDSRARFYGTQFHSLVNFHATQFDSLADFSWAQFDSLALFNAAHFHALVNYYYAQFYSQVDFSGVQFDSLVRFNAARFHSSANYSYTQFHSQVDFSGAQFDSLINFRGAQFDSQADFSLAQFDSLADFSYARFNQAIDFDSATLPNTLRFTGIKTNTEIDLTATRRLDSAQKAQGRFFLIDFRDAPIEKFKLRYDEFRVYWPTPIDATEYERLTNIYEGLLKNFKDRGYLTSYATLDKEYQAFKDLQNPDASPIKKLLNKINYHWNNYGYNKEWIWLWTLVFLLISTVINWLAFPYLIKKVYPVDMIEEAIFDNKPEKRQQFTGTAFLKGKVHLNFKYFIFALYYTILIFFGLKLTTERINFKRHGGIALIFTEYLLGIICLGYLANFIISSGLIGE